MTRFFLSTKAVYVEAQAISPFLMSSSSSLRPLAMSLYMAQKEKEAPLTEAEVLAIRDDGLCVQMDKLSAEKMYETIGHDIDPENAWNNWLQMRENLDIDKVEEFMEEFNSEGDEGDEEEDVDKEFLQSIVRLRQTLDKHRDVWDSDDGYADDELPEDTGGLTDVRTWIFLGGGVYFAYLALTADVEPYKTMSTISAPLHAITGFLFLVRSRWYLLFYSLIAVSFIATGAYFGFGLGHWTGGPMAFGGAMVLYSAYSDWCTLNDT